MDDLITRINRAYIYGVHGKIKPSRIYMSRANFEALVAYRTLEGKPIVRYEDVTAFYLSALICAADELTDSDIVVVSGLPTESGEAAR